MLVDEGAAPADGTTTARSPGGNFGQSRDRAAYCRTLYQGRGSSYCPCAQPACGPAAMAAGFPQLSRMSARPATIASAATMRTGRSGSPSTTTAISAPNSTLVSRSAATMAIGATVMAQMAMP